MRHETIEKNVNLMIILIVVAISIGGLIEIVRSFVPGGMAWGGGALTIALFASAFATALVSPLLFALVRRVDPESARAPT